MNEWSRKRKQVIFLITLACLIVLLGVPLFFFLHQTPSCSDNKMNGDESGVDCGGSCKLLCKANALPLLIKGDPRVIKVATSTFETVVVIENPNISAHIDRAGYTIKLYNATDLTPIKVIEAVTFIPKASTFALFEGPNTFDTVPVRATFEWKDETLVWVKDTAKVQSLKVDEAEMVDIFSSPRLDALLINESLVPIANIEVVALVSDPSGNIIAASKTFVEQITGGGKVPLVFIWPAPFIREVGSIEVLPRILPDRSFIR